MSLLEVKGIDVFYGESQALWDVSFKVDEGQLVTLVGSNGAGKTTTLKTISGMLTPTSGQIVFSEDPIHILRVHEIANRGITLVPEGRQLFPQMTVEENLLAGSYLRRARESRDKNLTRVYSLFPVLKERKRQIAETLSGGEQQMLAIGRALMQEPRLIMFDEPSLGLAPILVKEIFNIIKELHKKGATILLVEQNINQAIKVADYCYVIENGRITIEGAGKEIEQNPKVQEAFLGL